MFIGRRQDGSIYGLWTVKQWDGQEELPDGAAEVVAFVDAQKMRMVAAQERTKALEDRVTALESKSV